jgi:hypothetical protein
VARKLRLNETAAKLASGALGPEVASRVAAGATGLGGTVAPAAAANAAAFGTMTNNPQGPITGYDPVPYNHYNDPQTVVDVATGPEAAARYGEYLRFRQGLLQDDQASRLAQQYQVQRDKDAFQLQMAGAQRRANIALNAESTLRGIINAHQMAQNAQQNIASAITSQPNFG